MTLAERNEVHLMWVLGHKGIEGNEIAEIAK
jgi:ribonuclease HI